MSYAAYIYALIHVGLLYLTRLYYILLNYVIIVDDILSYRVFSPVFNKFELNVTLFMMCKYSHLNFLIV